MKAAPRAMPITPSVAMNGGKPTTTTSAALNSPQAVPATNPASALDARLPCEPMNTPPVTTPDSAITAPGDRSMPPAMITIAAPIAAMP